MKRFISLRIAGLLAPCAILLLGTSARAETDPLPSWNDGPAMNNDWKQVFASGQ